MLRSELKSENCLIMTSDSLTAGEGSARVLIQLRSLAALGVNLYVLTREQADDFEQNCSTVKNELESHVIHWQPVVRTSHNLKNVSVLTQFKFMLVGFRLLKSQEIHVIHCHQWALAVSAAVLAKLYKVPLVLSLSKDRCSKLLRHSESSPRFWLQRVVHATRYLVSTFVLKSSRHLIFASELAARNYVEGTTDHLAIPHAVIPPPFDVEFFDPSNLKREADQRFRLEQRIWPGSYVVVCFGGDNDQECLDAQLQIFRKLQRYHEKSLLVFLNLHSTDVIYEAAKKNKVAKGKLRIISATQEQLPIFLNMTTIGFVFFRNREGNGEAAQTVNDFLSMGVPVVTSSYCADWEDIIATHGFGYGLEDFSDLAINDLLVKISGDSLPQKEQIYQEVRAVFASERTALELQSIYRILIA
jgi:hypothetical protein